MNPDNLMGLVCLPLIIALTGCTDAPLPPQEKVPEPRLPPASPPVAAALPANAVLLHHGLTLEHIDPGDLDGDGRLDLTLASHVESRVETLFQPVPRQFQAAGPLPDPGFHPNGTLTLMGGDGGRYLVLNAETANALRAYRGVAGTAALPVGDTPVPAPMESVAVVWPEWGRTLAVTSKRGAEVQLLPGYDPARPEVATPLTVKATNRTHLRLTGLTQADLYGTGVPALLVAIPQEGRIVALTPRTTGDVGVDTLWQMGPYTAPECLLPADINRDGHQDLIVLGQMMKEVAVLINDGQGGLSQRLFPLGDPLRHVGFRAGAVTRDQDGTLLLWASLERHLGILRWTGKGAVDPEPILFRRVGRDPIRFATADLDGDGHQDLAMGSAVASLPALVLFGPLAPHLEAFGTWLEGYGPPTVATKPTEWNLLEADREAKPKP